MPKGKNVPIDYTSREFDSIKEDLLDHAKRYYPDNYKDFSEASFGSMVLDSVSYIGDVLSFYLDYNVNESFLDTAIEFENVRKHAKALGYNYAGAPSTYGVVDLYILVPSNGEGTAPDVTYLPTIKRGTTLAAQNGSQFVITEDVDFNNTKSDYVAARFNPDTGATTFFAVRSAGQVQSGQYFISNANLMNGSFERYKKVRVGSPNISEIFEVYDSEGNRYYETTNLSQEVVFMETTNKNAAADGVRSILKPFVVARRFVVEQDDTGTYLQFGFGTDNSDEHGLIDPSKIALKMHGKKHISNASFDPTKLLSTNKLGLAPSNTVLTIVYRSNGAGGPNVGANTIDTFITKDLQFTNVSTLNQATLTTVRDSLEVTNPEALVSTSPITSTTELKIRAKAHYATQNRAVTKQDYESVVYNMPNKFGSVKRANIVNDPSATNRRLALYVVSEDNNRILAKANTATKNNLKNWLSQYKSMNDIIDIKDAIIANFGIQFNITADPRANKNSVLLECKQAIADYFEDPLYIGEPVYITKIYEILNKIDNVSDVKRVRITSKTDEGYESTGNEVELNLSRDGSFIKVPNDVIMELRYPDRDIVGMVR
jgi:hypothetical protein